MVKERLQKSQLLPRQYIQKHALEEEGKKPPFLFLSLVSIQKSKYKLLYSKQLKFRNVTVMYDIHTIKIHEDSAMQKIIHYLVLHSYKH